MTKRHGIRAWWRRGRKPKTTHVKLDREDFNILVRGGGVVRDGVVIVLADIGFQPMMEAVSNSWEDHWRKSQEVGHV